MLEFPFSRKLAEKVGAQNEEMRWDSHVELSTKKPKALIHSYKTE